MKNAGFAINDLKQPKKIGETRNITKGLATCQSLGARFSHVTVAAYGGPRRTKPICLLSPFLWQFFG